MPRREASDAFPPVTVGPEIDGATAGIAALAVPTAATAATRAPTRQAKRTRPVMPPIYLRPWRLLLVRPGCLPPGVSRVLSPFVATLQRVVHRGSRAETLVRAFKAGGEPPIQMR